MTELEKLRHEKDEIDLELLHCLCRRIGIVQRIWAHKKTQLPANRRRSGRVEHDEAGSQCWDVAGSYE